MPLLICAAALLLAWPAQGQDARRWSPDRTRYAVASVWLIEPDGGRRAGIRGCERWDWIDNARLFCEGSINPSTGVYLIFDATSGRELREYIGSHFVWSPNHSSIASFGNVPHFMAEETKSDSREIDGRLVYPREEDRRRHWFRSEPEWSADSERVAFVDSQDIRGALFLIVLSPSGQPAEHPLPWQIPAGDWPPPQDISVRWDGNQVVVRFAGLEQIVAVR
jgi:hypothetical protein